VRILIKFRDWKENGIPLQSFSKIRSLEFSLYLFAAQRGLPGGFLGVGWGLAGGWLGVPRDVSLGTPSQPPAKSLEFPFIPKTEVWYDPRWSRIQKEAKPGTPDQKTFILLIGLIWNSVKQNRLQNGIAFHEWDTKA